MSEAEAYAVIEAIARNSYGRLIAFLAARSGDISGAEDALGDAFVAALARWPETGTPSNPEAWLLHAARNRVIDVVRRRQVRESSQENLLRAAEEAQAATNAPGDFPDERLKLLFVCAHPAIDSAARTPLMLQTVLRVDAARIASAFLVSPTAMGQRLVRAKHKIRAAKIAFSVPGPAEWEERVSFVLDAIYSAYTAGWDSLNEAGSIHHELSTDALSLGRMLVNLMPGEPEARGLLALMLHCEARKAARFTKTVEFIPLDQQDTTQWSQPMIEEAEDHLRVSSTYQKMGRYQLEAAIQSIHAHRRITGVIDWAEIVLLYEGLIRVAPGIGAQVGRAVALAQAGEPTQGLTSLEEIPPDPVKSYQPYWAARGHLLQLLNRSDEAQAALTRAASLTEDPALRAYLFKKSKKTLLHGSPTQKVPFV